HVVVARQHYRCASRYEFGGMADEAIKPSQLVVEFWSRLRVPIGQVDGCDQESMDSRLDVAGLAIFRIARQVGVGQHWSMVSRENGHAVPGTLPLPHCFVPEIAEGLHGKRARFRLELLQTDYVRLSFG